jgi:hypothetical protein
MKFSSVAALLVVALFAVGPAAAQPKACPAGGCTTGACPLAQGAATVRLQTVASSRTQVVVKAEQVSHARAGLFGRRDVTRVRAVSR